MKVLAIDSSSLVASVAFVTETELLAEYTVNYRKTHSQTLLPMLDEIVQMTGIELNDIDGIAISKGPGSFTGLRIGGATAKGLALVLDVPIIPVPTVDSLAYNLYKVGGLICPLMDARRNQAYTGLYKWEVNEFKVVLEQEASYIEEIINKINEIGEEVIFLGDGVDVFKNQIQDLTNVPFSFAPPHLLKQRAGAVGGLGIEYLKKGFAICGDDFSPTYLRKSQAERDFEKMNKYK